MARLQNELGPQGLQVVGVSIDDTDANVVPYAERYRFPFPIGHLDREGALKLADLKPTARPFVPYLMFVDWQGSVRFDSQTSLSVTLVIEVSRSILLGGGSDPSVRFRISTRAALTGVAQTRISMS